MKAAGTYARYLQTELMRVVPTYLVLGTIVPLFALLLSRINFPSIRGEHEDATLPEDRGTFGALLQYLHLWLAVLANFCNVGAQVSSWSSLIPYIARRVRPEEVVAVPPGF